MLFGYVLLTVARSSKFTDTNVKSKLITRNSFYLTLQQMAHTVTNVVYVYYNTPISTNLSPRVL